MADLNELKDINSDLPLTSFPNTIDNLESFSDANDEINSVIAQYKSLLKQGATSEAESLYEQYSLKQYIVSSYILNKIQQMIIACERTISSVKKYFSFSESEPTGTTAQPNGYIWGKILSTGASFKKVLLKLKDNGTYVNVFPQTTADNVLISEDDTETVKDKLETKMDKENPTGTGALSINRKGLTTIPIGENSVALGNGCTAQGKNAISMGDECHAGGLDSVAMGKYCQSLREGSITQGKGLVANSAHQIVQGKYNTIGNYAYILGGGTSLSDTKNLFTVDWDGNSAFSGDVTFLGGKSVSDIANDVTDLTNNLSGLKIFKMTENTRYLFGYDLGRNVLLISTHPTEEYCGMWIACLTRKTDDNLYLYSLNKICGGDGDGDLQIYRTTSTSTSDASGAGIYYTTAVGANINPVIFAINLNGVK